MVGAAIVLQALVEGYIRMAMKVRDVVNLIEEDG
jgi:hypothetical protein